MHIVFSYRISRELSTYIHFYTLVSHFVGHQLNPTTKKMCKQLRTPRRRKALLVFKEQFNAWIYKTKQKPLKYNMGPTI